MNHRNSLNFLNAPGLWDALCDANPAISEPAWTNVVRDASDIFAAIAYRSTNDAQISEDCAQELLIRTMENREVIRERHQSLGNYPVWWMLLVLRRMLQDLAQKRERDFYKVGWSDAIGDFASDEKLPSPPQQAIINEMETELDECVQKLDDKKRRAYDIYIRREFGTKEACAKELNMPEGTFKGHLRMALEQVRDCMSDYEFGI